MNKKSFWIFLLFFVVLILGCTGGTDDGSSDDQPGVVSKGPLNATVMVNGKQSDQLQLVSGQRAEIGLKLKNGGVSSLRNVEGILLGCLESDEDVNVDSILTNNVEYFGWTIEAPILGTSEVIRCPTTIRICFDYETEGYKNFVFLPEEFRDVTPVSDDGVTSDYLDIIYNFGVMRVICNKEGGTCTVNPVANEIVGQITTRNSGPGWIDYVDYSGTNLSIYTLRSLTLDFTGFDDEKGTPKVKIAKFGSYDASELASSSKKWLTDDDQNLTLTESNVGSENVYLLKLIQGKELFSRLTLEVSDADYFQDEVIVYPMYVTIDHGYCIDVATINTEMRGR